MPDMASYSCSTCGCSGEYAALVSRDVSDTSIVDARGTVALRAPSWKLFPPGFQPFVQANIFFKSAAFPGEGAPAPSAALKHMLGPFPLVPALDVVSSTCARPDVSRILQRVDEWASA